MADTKNNKSNRKKETDKWVSKFEKLGATQDDVRVAKMMCEKITNASQKECPAIFVSKSKLQDLRSNLRAVARVNMPASDRVSCEKFLHLLGRGLLTSKGGE